MDGKFGPKTARSVAALFEQPSELTINQDGWLVGDAKAIPAHRTWYGGPLVSGKPKAVVCHVSATHPGSALNMANRRAVPISTGDRKASWHASVEADGTIVQMVPFTHVAWHAGSITARSIPGVGGANARAVGIELIGFEAGPFPEAQVLGYARLLRALRLHYGIERKHAMVTHAWIDPSRRTDPGKVWMENHAERVLDIAYM